MKKKINYGSQFIDNKDIRSVVKTLKEEKITTGKEVINFEKSISRYLKCKYSKTCSSGTSALFLAMLAIKIRRNDKIIMPVINFIASYNVAKILGAQVFLADVDKNTGQMTPETIQECCKKFKLKRIKAIVTMYNTGYPQNVENFKKLKRKLKCFIIEDACHALGASYKIGKKNYMVGSCMHADISTFSLHPLKTITSGEGGIVTTNSRSIDIEIEKYRSLGIMRKKYYWKYDINSPGLNFRLNDFQCALANSQLKKIRKFLNYRKLISQRYDDELNKNKKYFTIAHKRKYNSSFHLYLLKLKNFNLEKKDKFIKYMGKNNIFLQYHYIPINKFKLFKGKYLAKNAEIYYKETVSLPIHYKLTKNDQSRIIKLIKQYFN